MRLNPDFFKLDKKAQDNYRLTMSIDQQEQLEKYLVSELFNTENYDDKLSPEQKERYNEIIQPLRGIGDDCFWFNEYLGDKTLLDFKSYYDFDYQDYIYQVATNKREFKNYKEEPYRGCLYRRWARLFIDTQFTYADIQTASGRIFDILLEASTDSVQKFIPYKLINGKNNGKAEKNGFLLDVVKDANGKEAELEELQDRQNQYINKRRIELADEWDRHSFSEIYIFDEVHFGDKSTHFIFSDRESMRHVRFEHFMTDSRKLQAPTDRFFKHVEKEKQALEDYTAEQFNDIQKNFDSKIVRFKKKRKIILSSQALNDLSEISDE